MWPELWKVDFFITFLCFKNPLAVLLKLDVCVKNYGMSLFPSPIEMCFLSLQLKVSRKNLLNVCKLIFKISRSEKNDSLIQSDSILGECHPALPLTKCCT